MIIGCPREGTWHSTPNKTHLQEKINSKNIRFYVFIIAFPPWGCPRARIKDWLGILNLGMDQ